MRQKINHLMPFKRIFNEFRILKYLPVFFISFNGYAQLSGTYTVGGSSPNFPTLDSAFNYMEINGVAGKVRLNIRSGTRTLCRIISAIPGASATNTIKVAPDPSNTAPVVFQNKNTATKYYILFIKQNFISFDSLTFRADSSYAYGNIIVFGADNNYTTFNSCTFYGKDTTSISSINALITYNNKNVSYMKVTNCTFFNGSSAIYLGSGTNCEIKNNRIINYYYSACFFANQDKIIYEGNYSIDNNKYQFAYGVYFDLCDYSTINNNKIYVGGIAGMGLRYSHGNASSTNLSKIYNNFISGFDSTKSGKFYGIYVGACAYVGVYFNTIATFNNSTNSRAAYIVQESVNSGNSYFFNNIFYARVGYAVYYSDIFKLKADYNLLYSKGNFLVSLYGSDDLPDLVALQKKSSLDSHSISKNIVFPDVMDLHTFTFDLYKKGMAISGINVDIDGFARKKPKPDIGANEQRLPTRDLAIISVVNNLCWGNSDVSVKIKNMGWTRIDSCKITWQVSVNGGTFVTQSICKYSGALLTGSDTIVKLGTYSFSKGNDYKLKIWLDSPNNKKDSITSNDILNQFAPVGVKGTYTIGGSSPDFTSIEKAFNMLEKNGLCGPVRLLLRQGTYNEQINIGPIAGVSGINTIKLVSDPQNTSTPKVIYSITTSDNWVFKFQNTSFISIDSINIASIGTTHGRVIVFSGINSFLSFHNDSITGISVAGNNSFDYAVIYDEINRGNINQNLLISGCFIKNGSYGIYLYGNNPYDKVTGITLIGNKISDFSYQGINSYNHQNVKILNNVISDNNSSNSPAGIVVSGDNFCEMASNKISIGGKVNPVGISMSTCTGKDSFPLLIANNCIAMYSQLPSGKVIGVKSIGSSYLKIVYNSIHIMGGDSTSTDCYFNSGNNYTILNNNLTNFSKGFVYESPDSGIIKPNHNNLFTLGKYIAYIGKSKSGTLKNLQTLQKIDSNSISFNPVYPDSFNLNQRVLEFDSKAIPLNDIRFDFYGTKRDSILPDIGAYEFDPYINDLQLRYILLDSAISDCGKDSTELTIVIRNNGLDSLYNIKLYTFVYQSDSLIYTLLDTLKHSLYSGTEDAFKLSSFRTTEGGYYRIKVFRDSFDNNQWNDSIITETDFVNSSPTKLKEQIDTICDNETHQLIPNIPSQTFLKWYSKQKGGACIAKTDTITVKNIKTDSTLYASAVYKHVDHIGVLNAGPNGDGSSGSGGVMFNLLPKVDMNIDSMYANFKTAGLQTILIYIKRGTYKGYEEDTSSWKLADTSKVTTPYGGIYKTFKLTKPIFLEKDSLYGIYIYYDTKHYIKYPGVTFVSKDLTMISGSALDSKFVNPYAGWHFPGKIYYSTIKYCESDRAKYSLKVNKSPVISIGKDTSYCAMSGMNLLLDPGPGYVSYQWSTSDTSQSVYAKDGGKYSVIVSNGLCHDSDEMVITKNANPLVNLGKDITYCANQGINIFLNSGSILYKSYHWSTGAKTRNIKVTTFGTFSIIVTDDNGCKNYDTVLVNKQNNPTVNLGNDTFYCNRDGLKLLLDAGPGYKKYSWSNTDTTQTSFITSKGKYKVSVEDSFGCFGKDSVIITEKMSPIVNLPRDTFYCKGVPISVRIYAGMGHKDYLWSTSEKTENIKVSTMGTYSVIVTGMNDCLGRDTFRMFEISPFIDLGKDTGYCIGSSFNMHLTAPAGYVSYKWSNSSTSQTINIQTKNTYSVVVTDSLGCKNSDTMVVSEIDPKVNLGNDTAYCKNNGFNKQLDAGKGFLEYQWMDSQKNQVIQAMGAGSYSVIAKAAYGCYGMDTIIVTENANPVVNLGADRVLNPSLPINETLDAGAGYKSYLWSNSESTQSILVSSAGNYSVIVSDNNNCDGRDTIAVRYWNPTDIQKFTQVGVKVYPNPANDHITITSENFVLENIKVFTITGKEVYQLNPNQRIVAVNTSEWSNGIYIIRFDINGTSRQFQWIINH